MKEKVTKEEFDNFIKLYPNKLKTNCHTICEPPMVSFNDFSIAKYWPESMVASIVKNSSWDKNQKDDYYIDKQENKQKVSP